MEELIFSRNISTATEISYHLQSCDNQFFPTLSSRVVINDYAIKIREFAKTFEAYSGAELVGLVAVYENQHLHEAFVTSVSTKESFWNMGIATHLISLMIDYFSLTEISRIELEVSTNAVGAMNLYLNSGFCQIGEDDCATITMYRNV